MGCTDRVGQVHPLKPGPQRTHRTGCSSQGGGIAALGPGLLPGVQLALLLGLRAAGKPCLLGRNKNGRGLDKWYGGSPGGWGACPTPCSDVGPQAGLEAEPGQVTMRLYWGQEHTGHQVHAAQPSTVQHHALSVRDMLALGSPPHPGAPTQLPALWTVRHASWHGGRLMWPTPGQSPVPTPCHARSPTEVQPQPSGCAESCLLLGPLCLGTDLSLQAHEEVEAPATWTKA